MSRAEYHKLYAKTSKRKKYMSNYMIEYRKRKLLEMSNEERVEYIEKCKVNARKRSDYHKKWRENNLEKVKAYNEKHGNLRRKGNRKKGVRVSREFQKRNKALMNYHRAKRRATKKNATPSWLSEQQYLMIKNIYKKCKDLSNLDGIKRQVDHIIPLTSKLVCGLHVPWNLQIIKASDNSKKKNKILTKEELEELLPEKIDLF